MKNNRVVTAAFLVGVVIVAVTFLGAARMSGDDAKSPKDVQKILAPVKSGSKGVVVFGNVDVDNGIGLLQLYPETLPQPSKVKKVLVSEGQLVKKGQKLVEFDTELADLTVDEAKTALAQAQGALLRAEALVKQADATLAGHRVLIEATEKTVLSKRLELDAAQVDLDEKKRLGPLVGGGVDLEIAKKKFESAEKALDSERIKLEGLKSITPQSKKDEAEGAVAEAKAAVAKQKVMLDKAIYGLKLMTLTAPDDGTIVRSQVAEGLTFGAQTRQPAIWFQSKGVLVVRAEIDQEFASRVALGQEATIQDDGDSSQKWNGKVIRIADSFLPKRLGASASDLLLNDARVLECTISLEGGDPKSHARVGQRVKVSIGVE